MLKLQNKSPRKCSPKNLFLKDSEVILEKHYVLESFLKKCAGWNWRPATLFKILD